MAIYTNVPCAHCGKPFTEEDDIVVCPICGAPHHRSCYMELGECALAAENHAAGKSWQNPLEAKASAAAAACPRCGTQNPEGAKFCSGCGINLAMAAHMTDAAQQPNMPPQQGPQGYQQGEQPPMDPRLQQLHQMAYDPNALYTPVGPVTVDEDFDGVTALELAAYIGPNSRRYLTSFKIMKESHKDFSFNWSSLIFNYCYFFYRKMYKPAILLVAMMALLAIPRFLYSSEYIRYYLNSYMNLPVEYDLALISSLAGFARILNAVQLALSFTIATFSNKLYYTHVVREIKKIRETVSKDLPREQYLNILAQNGRTSLRMGYGAALLSFLLLFGISWITVYNIISTVM